MGAKGRALQFAYNLLLMPLRATFPVYALAARARGREPGELAERIGRIASVPAGGVWIQAASIGEIGIAESLVDALAAARPGLPLLVTATTRTGRALSDRLIAGRAALSYFPLDFPDSVRRALDRIRPRALVLIETELWPNLLLEAGRRGIPVFIANGRISDRTLGRYRRIRGLVSAAIGAVRIACVQSALDAERFEAIGLPSERVRITGNIKFSRSAAPSADEPAGARLASALGAAPGDEIWVGGSTAEGEEAALLSAFDSLPAPSHGRRILVLAPRRPERFDRVAEILSARGRPWRRRSRVQATDPSARTSPAQASGAEGSAGIPPDGLVPRVATAPADSRGASARPDRDARAKPEAGSDAESGAHVVLLDTLGELTALYGSATVAFVGGSLVPIGGHNLVEPAARGVAPVFGPHIANARDVASRLLAAGGAFEVKDAAELAALFRRLANDPALRARAGQSARRVVEESAGALDRTLSELLPLLAAPMQERA